MTPATLTHPMGSLGEEVISEELRCPPVPYVRTLAEWKQEFPTLTRTCDGYRPWKLAQGEAS